MTDRKNIGDKERMYVLQNRIIIASLLVIALATGSLLIIYPKYLAPAETNMTLAMSKISSGDADTIYVVSNESDVCYWITPTFDYGYYLEIKQYRSDTGDCYGDLIGIEKIELDAPVNIVGSTDCICSQKVSIRKVDAEIGTFLEVKAL